MSTEADALEAYIGLAMDLAKRYSLVSDVVGQTLLDADPRFTVADMLNAERKLEAHLRTQPEGYVLVPVEPTPAKSDAARRGFQDADFCYLRPKPSIHDVRRMFLNFYRTAAAWEGK